MTWMLTESDLVRNQEWILYQLFEEVKIAQANKVVLKTLECSFIVSFLFSLFFFSLLDLRPMVPVGVYWLIRHQSSISDPKDTEP